MIEFYDTHTHLNETTLFLAFEEYLRNFKNQGGKGLCISGASEAYNENVCKIFDEQKNTSEYFVFGTFGFHPSEVTFGEITEENYEKKIENIENLFQKYPEQAKMLGEIGIDLHEENALQGLEMQKTLFSKQLELAKKLGLPVVIHSRDARKETLEILKNHSELKIYFHCRGYGPQEIQEALELFPNLRIGFCGNITYKKADPLRESLKKVPFESLLFETDAPRLSPQALRGTTNEPANVKLIYEYVAEFLSIPLEKLAKDIENNFWRLIR